MCPSEVSEVEHSLWQEYQDAGVVVFGIASLESESVLEDFRDTLGLTFPILMDTDGSVHEQYRLASAFPSAAYPQDWIVGSDGIIVYANQAFEIDEMVAAVERELAGSE